MNKNFCSLGLMSGTSMDGIDLSIIKSDGELFAKIIENKKQIMMSLIDE